METTQFNLAEPMWVLGKGKTLETAGYVINKKRSIFFTSEANYRRFHKNENMDVEDCAVGMPHWHLILIVAEQLKASGATHVGIDPVDGNFMSFPIQVFIDDVESMMLKGRRCHRPSEN